MSNCPRCHENHSLSQCPRWRVPASAALALLLSACASVPRDGSETITVPAKRVAECKAEGGCVLLTKAQVLDLIDQAAQLGAQQITQSLDSNGCRKGSL